MILAAGLGTRLKPFTDKHPKALFPVERKPLLEHIIVKLSAAGFCDIVINVHHFAEQIIDFLKINNDFGLNIRISDERSLLRDTGGGVRYAADLLKGDAPFIVHNVDIMSNINLRDLYNSHSETDSIATLVVGKRQTSRYLLFDNDRLCGWENIKTGEIKSPYADFSPAMFEPLAFGGIQVLSQKALETMKTWPDCFSIIDFYLGVCSDYPVRAWTTDNIQLQDVGKAESLGSR
jgi:NDP-sugar pyrophosphorylase family protein